MLLEIERLEERGKHLLANWEWVIKERDAARAALDEIEALLARRPVFGPEDCTCFECNVAKVIRRAKGGSDE
jgi:hypothetical protein